MGEALVIALALGTLASFGAIFCIALAEYRRVDPVDYGTPWGDIIDPVALRRATEAAEAFLEGKAASAKPEGGAPSNGARGLTQQMASAHSHGEAV